LLEVQSPEVHPLRPLIEPHGGLLGGRSIDLTSILDSQLMKVVYAMPDGHEKVVAASTAQASFFAIVT